MPTKTKQQTIEIEAAITKPHQITYWYDNGQEMPDHEQEHIRGELELGNIMGSLFDGDAGGWWELTI